MPKLITELGYLGLEVSNLPRWEQFATDVLGLTVKHGIQPNTRLLRMDANDYRFILTEGPADDFAFAGWRSPNGATVEAFGKHLDSHGVAWSWARDDELALRSVERMLHFTDPSGCRHEVFTGPQLALDRFSSPKVASGFVTGAGGLGHVVFSSRAYAETLEFAHQVIGLATTDHIRLVISPEFTFDVAFMHINERHHSMAIAPALPDVKKRIHHFMIEVNAVEEVGFARDRCLALGLPVAMDIGQHPNDRMISFYGQTPSGFHVEFGYGGVKVDAATWQVASYPKLSEWGHRPSNEVSINAAPIPDQKTPSAVNPGTKESIMSATGIWNVVIKTPMGDNSVSFDLQAEGSALHGSIKGPAETNEIYDGKADGNTLTWRSKVSTPMPMDLEFTATIDGASISGGAKSPFGTAPFSGARA
jgi:2,3-dihydroxybiphenyl 1,2-dioxygenase